ncbi:LLM class flavin-dependent oxidoreductase [Salinibacillus xinjiangensis]|uniref:MsnO8 family LLM class oxidoreductase n=1 Tax=Salinibacillus xinjiangensis TaxID=1229268 RepID=A0A6G1X4N6_9BACI|nr:LLM class flavin-dependent oxidoreductase [Salinibacillus xinjiangensis]MRG85840.1 MsnO8 family LLM class oxidoreductase [Salinibacillus xinjiangensis]
MKLSVLDQAPISKGDTATTTLKHTVELAQYVEKLGYTRFWVAEHHNTKGLAGTSPEVLISHIASMTNHIRVGSGGVLLPQYSPLKVAENFKVLEALFPNRIDLGIGRSPGGNHATRLALTDHIQKSLNEFPRQVADLSGFLTDSLPASHDFKRVKATPRTITNPSLWVLGLSERGAKTAAENSTRFTFGHFINPTNGQKAIETYFEHFKVSSWQKRPMSNACVFVVCAETKKEAELLALSQDLWLLNVETGKDTRIPSIKEVKSKRFTQRELEKIQKNRKRCIIGTPDDVRKRLEELSELYRTDEFLIITNIFDFNAKLKSYRLLAEEFQLEKRMQ